MLVWCQADMFSCWCSIGHANMPTSCHAEMLKSGHAVAGAGLLVFACSGPVVLAHRWAHDMCYANILIVLVCPRGTFKQRHDSTLVGERAMVPLPSTRRFSMCSCWFLFWAYLALLLRSNTSRNHPRARLGQAGGCHDIDLVLKTIIHDTYVTSDAKA